MAKNWIQGMHMKKGALHSQLGIPQGQKIPAATLNTAAQAGGTLARRARLAKTLSGFAGGGEVSGHSPRAAAKFKRACHGN